jgi:predicted aldo/keto reductase-like oxidoreductase
MGLLQPSEGALEKTPAAPKLEYRTLGKTGLKVTTLGFGCMITSDPSVIERAADIGINFFDTARGYQQGNNERMVGAALGARRKQVILCTKSEAPTVKGLQEQLETSLRELKTDYIDIWYLHSKDRVADVPDELIEFQQQAKKAGKIRFAGLSTHNSQLMLPFLAQKGVFDVALVAYNFAMDATMDKAVETAANAGIGIVGMKVMAGGFRSLKPTDPVLGKLKRDGAMLAALKWTLNRPHIATTIPGMTDMEQLDENLQAMAHPFTGSDEKILAAKLEQIGPLYCRMCRRCDGACQKGLPVSDMLRILSYADGYKQFALARERFQELDAKHTAVRCGDCAECTVQCPNGVRVSARLTRAQELFG